jgi:putative aldouronate transport system permease protein
MKVSFGRRVFEGVNFLIMLGLCAVIVLPFVHIIAISLSNAQAITRMEVGLIPKGFYLDAYKKMVVNHVFVRGFINTIFITLIYTSLAIIICIMSAYAFSRKFYGKKALNYFFIITMYFNGGLIPTYIWVAKYLKMYNTYLVLIIPGLVSVFYIIVVRTQIEQIPISLIEAAIIDGANQFQVLFRIIIPTIKPTIAAICMFLVLGKWNGWFDVLVYIRDKDKWTMQYYLREVVFTASMSKDLQDMAQVKLDEAINISPENLKMAAIILVALPVLCVYPFVQKYFVKGMLAGSVKG